MRIDLQAYTDFYKTRHQGHKLEWDHALGPATLRARFNAGHKDLSVSLYQAVVLLFLNDQTETGYEDIFEATRMGETRLRQDQTRTDVAMTVAELKRTLQSLACANKVLRTRCSKTTSREGRP